jgi:hypothetical protein
VQWIEDKLRAYERRAEEHAQEAGRQLCYVIWDMAPISHMDAQVGGAGLQQAGCSACRGNRLARCACP